MKCQLKGGRSYEFQFWLDGISQTKNSRIEILLEHIGGKHGVSCSNGCTDEEVVFEVVLIKKSNIVIQGGSYTKAMFGFLN